MLDREIELLEELDDQMLESGRYLMEKCQGSIFPCDALALTVLGRTFNLVHGFKVLITGYNYECAASLLRLSLDNILRFYGVTTCEDPHHIANEVLNGVSLRKLKHSSGDPMTDAFLVKLLGAHNPWLVEAYEILSGFIHLSDRHFQHMLLQSEVTEDGSRTFSVSDEDDYVPDEQKANLVRTFSVVTRGATQMIREWGDRRENYGSEEELKQRFTKVV